MITYHNRTHMTAVPTELLQDTHLSVEAIGFAAILYALGDEGVELSELACQLNMPEERISVVLTELADTDYLQIRKEGDDEFCLELRGEVIHARSNATHTQGNLPERAGIERSSPQDESTRHPQLWRVCPKNAD